MHYASAHLKKRLTRKLSYRKDDCAMRPIYGCPENFESLSKPTATLTEIFNGLVTIKPMNMRTKFTHSWDNRGYSKNLGSPWICSLSLFS